MTHIISCICAQKQYLDFRSESALDPRSWEESLRRFCEGGDTTGHRDLHQHTQTAVRTRQDTVYSARPHGVAEVGALRAILEVPVPWATSSRDSCQQHIFPAANPGQRVADAMSPLNGTTTKHQLERLLGVATGTRRTALGRTVGSHPICGGARPEESPTPATSAGTCPKWPQIGHREKGWVGCFELSIVD